MPSAVDRASLIQSYRRGLLAELREAGIEVRTNCSTSRLVDLVTCCRRNVERTAR